MLDRSLENGAYKLGAIPLERSQQVTITLSGSPGSGVQAVALNREPVVPERQVERRCRFNRLHLLVEPFQPAGDRIRVSDIGSHGFVTGPLGQLSGRRRAALRKSPGKPADAKQCTEQQS